MTTPISTKEVVEYLKEHLTIMVHDGNFTNPNSRIIELRIDNEVISTCYFDVTQQREYEG